MNILENQILIFSCEEGNLSKVKELVEQGVDVHIGNDIQLRTASYYGHLEVVKYLVEQGADIHVLDDAPLIRAVTNNHLEVINYLRSVAGNKWKCYTCLIRATCLTLCDGWNKND